MRYLVLAVVLCAIGRNVMAATIDEAIRDCIVSQKFGRTYWLCDPEHVLTDEDYNDIRDKLTAFQVEPSCPCTNTSSCNRRVYIDDADSDNLQTTVVQHSFTGAIIIVDSWDTNTIEEQVKTIYDDQSMGFPQCDNGIIVVYNSENHRFYTYSGVHAQQRLTNDEMQIIQSRASNKFAPEEHHERLVYVLGDMNAQLRHEDLDLRLLGAYIGMSVGAAIVVAVLVVLLVIICSVSCCKTKLRSKGSIFVPPQPGSDMKGQQPYVIMPPGSHTADGRSTAMRGSDIESADTNHSAHNMPIPPFVDPNRPRSASSKHMDLY